MDMNELRRLLQSGQIGQDQLSQIALSGSFDGGGASTNYGGAPADGAASNALAQFIALADSHSGPQMQIDNPRPYAASSDFGDQPSRYAEQLSRAAPPDYQDQVSRSDGRIPSANNALAQILDTGDQPSRYAEQLARALPPDYQDQVDRAHGRTPGSPQAASAPAGLPFNYMRFESGPQAGRVVDMDKAIADIRRQEAQAALARGENPGAPRMMQVVGTGNGSTVTLQPQEAPAKVNLGVDTVEFRGNKYRYSKDEPGVAYMLDDYGRPKAKLILGYDMEGSMRLNKAKLDMEHTRAEIAHTQEQVATSQQARNTKEGIPGMGIPQSLLEKQFGKAPEGKRWNVNGELEDIPGGAGKALTESQGKATGLATRAQAAHDILLGMEGQGVNTPSLIKQAAESVPLVGGALGVAVNKAGVPSTQQNQVEQAQRDFVNAALRVESGASISQSEFDNARRQYFPQPGDTPDVIRQKQQAREREIKSLSLQAGPGAAEIRKLQNPAERGRAVFEAKQAVAQGRNKLQIAQRLMAMGVDPREAGL
jgi:hypothetical protein